MQNNHPYFERILLITIILGGLCSCASSPYTQQPTTQLVDVQKLLPNAVFDIRYATTNNFTGQAVYPSARCFLAQKAATALIHAQTDLEKAGYRLKIYDAYRPLSVQRQFWTILPDPRYVADPTKGSRHNKGYAIDVSLTDLAGNNVPMPTPFDDFTEKAHPDYKNLPPEIIQRRTLLRKIMEQHDFTQFPTEWWHYDYRGWKNKPNLDIDFDELDRHMAESHTH